MNQQLDRFGHFIRVVTPATAIPSTLHLCPVAAFCGVRPEAFHAAAAMYAVAWEAASRHASREAIIRRIAQSN